MSEIFLKLVNLSITASWLVLAVVVLRLVFKKAPKFIHCIMWALVGIRLVLPFSIESIFSLIPSAQTIPDELLTENSFDINTGINFVDDRVNDYLGSHYYEGVTVPANNGYDIMSILAVIWLAGIAVMLVYTLVSYLRIYKRVSASICVKENVFICDDIDTPFILGVFRPRIYLPSSMSEADAEYVIAHEKAHLKRLDHLWKPLGFLILAVYWFNPVLWLAYFLLCRDIEFACDEKVIGSLGAEVKKPYSDALINCSVPRKMLAACPLAFGETSVKSRIKSVLSFKKPAVWIIIASILAVSVAAVCLLTNPKTNDNKEPSSSNGSNVSGGVSSGISQEENVNASFNATVLEVGSNSILVSPDKDSNEFRSSDKISVSKNVISQIPIPNLAVGSRVMVVYNGQILESYPAQINNVFAIYLVEAGSVDVPYKISYANYTTKSWIYESALNISKMYQDSQKHLPIYKFESRDELEQFKASAGGSLSISESYDNIQSLNDATAEYGAEFFKDNALILTYLSSTSSTWRYGVKEIYNDGKNFKLTIMRSDSSETGDSAMCGWYVTTEVKKVEIKNCTSFDAVCNDIDSGISVPQQEKVVNFNLDASQITQIEAVRKPSHKGDEVTVTSADTISKFISYFNNVQFKEYKNAQIEPSSEMITYVTLTYKNGNTDTLLLKSYPEYNGQKYKYTDYGDEGEMEKILFGAYEINRAETYRELISQKITAVHILRKEKPIVNGYYQEKFVVAKSYTKDIPQMLKSFLNTNHCEEKEVGEWARLVAGWPEKYAVVACLEDNTTMILTVHFDKGSSRNYIAITTIDEQFVEEEKSPEYLERGYTRYFASEDFAKFILSILE
ncbi:MAG: hypothetical protein IJ027_05400 [Oscillospiraceae bacterium]|nr:hypothetical protein [Oscillospiraceae bacterium]